MVFLFCFYSGPTKFPASSVRLRIAGASGMWWMCARGYISFGVIIQCSSSTCHSLRATRRLCRSWTAPHQERIHNKNTFAPTYTCTYRHHRVHQDFLGIGPSLSLPIYDFAFTKGVFALQDFEYFEFWNISNPFECFEIRVGFPFSLQRRLDPTTHIVCSF